MMYAGSIPLASATLRVVAEEIQRRPPAAVTVETVARAFADGCATAFGVMAERAILRPLGLGRASLVAPSPAIDEQLRADLIQAVQDYEPANEELAVIVVGYDPDGSPHLWRVDNRSPTNCDIEGFAAIGSGGDEAEETFRIARYSRMRATMEETVLLTYTAKRRAEADNYVGPAMNVFLRDPQSKRWAALPSKSVRGLDALRASARRAERRAWRKAVQGVRAALMQQATTRSGRRG
jgi:hypothetical protein